MIKGGSELHAVAKGVRAMSFAVRSKAAGHRPGTAMHTDTSSLAGHAVRAVQLYIQ
jgi:hypothetical protein